MGTRSRLLVATFALLATQLVHGFVPADTSSEGWVGFYVGLGLLAATLAAIFGITARIRWGPPLAGVVGLAVTVGFFLYHAIPLQTPLTNPYFGEGVGAAAWLSVAVAMAAGAWTAFEASRHGRARSSKVPARS